MKKHTPQRVLSLLLTLSLVTALLLPTAAAAKAVEQFKDVSKDDWYYTYVDFVADKGYFKGTGDGTTFEPEGNMTRAMFVTVLARMAKARVKDNKASGFTDVPVGTWYTGSVKWAKDNGIVNGVGNGKFNPDGLVTREEMCTMMDRFMEYYAERYGVRYVRAKKAATFADADKVSAFASAAVKSCAKYGLINGYPDGLFHPQDYATRAQVAKVITMLYTVMRQIAFGPDDDETTYTVYYHNDPTDVEKYEAVSQDNNAIFQAKDASYDGYVFLGWATSADGKAVYQATDTIEIPEGETELHLYAKWLKTDDYVGIAVMNTMTDINTLMRKEILAFNVDVNADGEREQSLNLGTYALPENVLATVIEKSTKVALSLIGDASDMTPDERDEYIKGLCTDAEQTIDKLVDKIKDELGIDYALRDATVQQIKESVYTWLYENAGIPAKGLWANFRNVDGKYCVSAVNINASGVTLTVNVSDVDGTHPDYKGESRVHLASRVALAIAKDLYAELKDQGAGEYVDTVTLSSTVEFTFVPVEAAEGYPTVYPCTASITLGGDDLVSYKFDENEGSYVKITVNAKAQEAYTAGVESMIEELLDTDTVKAALTKLVNSSKSAVIAGFSGMTGAMETIGVNHPAVAIKQHVEAWLEANMDPDNFAESTMFQKYWMGENVTFDNTALVTLINTVADQAANYLYEETKAYCKNMLSSLYDGDELEKMATNMTNNIFKGDPENNVEPVKPEQVAALIAEYAAGLDLSALGDAADYVYAKMADWLRAKVGAEAANFAAAELVNLNDYLDGVINEKVEANQYYDYLEKVLKVKDIKEIAGIKLHNLATLLTNATFQNYVDSYGNNLVKRVSNVFTKVPESASVVVNGVVIDKDVVAQLKSDNTVELCNALAALINTAGLKDLSINSFAPDEGVEFTVNFSYNGNPYTYSFHLVIDITK